MGEEKTIDQLEAEYKTLLLEKLAAAKKEKEAQELAATEAKKKAEYEEEFKKKYNLTATSRLETTDNKPTTTNMVASQRDWQQFTTDFSRHTGAPVKGRRYEDIITDLVYNKNKMESV